MNMHNLNDHPGAEYQLMLKSGQIMADLM